MATGTPNDVLKLIKDEGIEVIDVRFCDLPGLMQHFSIPAHELTADVFDEGLGFDGSSIRGFQEIQESDMLLIPDPNTAVVDPFTEHATLDINCFVRDPLTGESYSRDPRYIVQKAATYLASTGYKPRYKEGYFPVPPMDQFQDLRSEMLRVLESVGIPIEVQHHEVGTAGQAEIDMRFDTLSTMADKLMLYKYVIKNVAHAAGK